MGCFKPTTSYPLAQNFWIIPNSAFLIPDSLFLGKPSIHPLVETGYINRQFFDRNWANRAYRMIYLNIECCRDMTTRTLKQIQAWHWFLQHMCSYIVAETIATSLHSGPIYLRNTYQATKPDSHSEESHVEIGNVYGGNSENNHQKCMSDIENRQPFEKYNLRCHWTNLRDGVSETARYCSAKLQPTDSSTSLL